MAYDTTGLPSNSRLLLGRGAILLAPLTDDIPGDFRHVGNCTAFTVTTENETTQHQNTRSGVRQVDAEVTTSSTLSASLTMTEWSFQNIAQAIAGTAVSADDAAANPAVAGGSTEITDVVKGRWYNLYSSTTERSANRVRDLGPGVVTIAGLAEGTDFVVDSVNGLVFFPATSSVSTSGTVTIAIAATAAAAKVQEVRGLVQTDQAVALKFIQKNANNNEYAEVAIHKIKLRGNGDLSFIGEDFGTIELQGTAEANEIYSPESPTISIYTHENANTSDSPGVVTP